MKLIATIIILYFEIKCAHSSKKIEKRCCNRFPIIPLFPDIKKMFENFLYLKTNKSTQVICLFDLKENITIKFQANNQRKNIISTDSEYYLIFFYYVCSVFLV